LPCGACIRGHDEGTIMATGQKRLAALMVVATVAVGGVAVTAGPAYAATSCDDAREQKSQVGLDAYRAKTKCSSIQTNYKVRAKLIRNGGPDYTSQWFTQLNVWYYSGWYTCYQGCSAGHETAPV